MEIEKRKKIPRDFCEKYSRLYFYMGCGVLVNFSPNETGETNSHIGAFSFAILFSGLGVGLKF